METCIATEPTSRTAWCGKQIAENTFFFLTAEHMDAQRKDHEPCMACFVAWLRRPKPKKGK